MDKIKAAQQLAEKLLDEACICQVGGDKGALKDEPESIKKSEEDLKKAVKMKQEAKISSMVDKISTYLGESPTDAQIAKIRLGVERNDRNLKLGNKMDPKAKANAKKRKESIKEADQVKIAQQKDTLLDNNDRIVKDKVDKETCLDPVPTVESGVLTGVQKWGKQIMDRKRKKGLKITQKKDEALKKVMKG